MKPPRISNAKLLSIFIKIGLIGFGGGSVLIPIIEKELIQRNDAMLEDEYVKHTVVANITPGILPVKLGATCGQQLNGTYGSLLASYGVAVPSVLMTVLIMALFRLFDGRVESC